mgnify:CR=1 FL=1|tara:strand:+ start:379 stop:1122 length:744 start_codon:yes stop_codon:yes gene_type:complete
MSHLIDPIEKTGLFRFCGKCPMCLKHFNPEDPPETGYFSNPMIRGLYLSDQRQAMQENKMQFAKSFEKFKPRVIPPLESLYKDEYFLACSRAQADNPAGNYFISNYGRLANFHTGSNEYHIINNEFMYNHIGEQTLRHVVLTQEYFDMLNNLLFFNKLLINERGGTKYDQTLIFMIVSNYNKYRQYHMGRDEIDEVIDRLEAPVDESPSTMKSQKRIEFDKARRSLRKILGSKKKTKNKNKKKKKKK